MHYPTSPFLFGDREGEDDVTERKMKSLIKKDKKAKTLAKVGKKAKVKKEEDKEKKTLKNVNNSQLGLDL